MACACINCAQREDWCIAQGLKLPYERKTWHNGTIAGNAIIEFKGIEHLKVWKLNPTSVPVFVVCKNCQTDFFERNEPLGKRNKALGPTVFTVPTGGNVWESEI